MIISSRLRIVSLFLVFLKMSSGALAQSASVPTSTVGVADTTIYNLISASSTKVSVSGLDPLKVVVSANSGTLKITTTTGLSAPTGYTSGQWSGANEIAFEGTLSNVNNALATLQYLGEGTITVSPTSSSILYYSGTGNYYEFISTNSSWTAAQSNANNKTYGSSTGYLATVTSSAEFTFIKNKAGLLNEIWLGGSDSGTEGVWQWMGGPENGHQFWQGKGTGATPAGSAIGGFYTSWNGAGEPNDSGNEDCLAVLTNGKWNDYPCSRLATYVIEYDGSGVSYSQSFQVGSANDPTVAFDTIRKNIEETSSENVYKNSIEHLQSIELTLNEQIMFHSKVLKQKASSPSTSFVDYNISIVGANNNLLSNGHFHQTEITNNKFRRRILVDAKEVFFKGDSKTTVFTSSLLYDYDIDTKKSKQLRMGLKSSSDRRSQTLKYDSDAKTIFIGTGISNQFLGDIFGGVSGDILYSSTDSNFTNEYTNVEAELETYSLSASAQLLGQYHSNTLEFVCEKISWCPSSDAEFWVKPALNLSYSKEYLINQRFTSNTSLGGTIVHPNIPMPEVTRVTLEPEFSYNSNPKFGEIKKIVSLKPSYACEVLKTNLKSKECGFGLSSKLDLLSRNNNFISNFYINYENLNLGARHEYGFRFKIQF